MTAVAEKYALGEWVVIGENPTGAPVGEVARISTVLENGSLIVAVGHMQHKHVIGARYCTRHAGPPPGRELVPLARSTTEPPRPAAPLERAVVLHEVAMPAEPPPARPVWCLGDRVRITRDQRDGTPAGTIGSIFGKATIHGYSQVKTDHGIVVVDSADLEPDINHGMHRGEREAAARAAQPQPEPSRLTRALQQRRQEDQEMAPPGNPGVPRGPQSEAHKRAIAEGKARRKAEREAKAALAEQGGSLADVVVEHIPDPDLPSAAPALRLVEPPVVDVPATPAATVPDGAPPDSGGVDDALRWAIGQGARQRLSVGALRMLVDTLEVVEREVRQ